MVRQPTEEGLLPMPYPSAPPSLRAGVDRVQHDGPWGGSGFAV